MSNWCSQTITFHGDQSKIEEIFLFISGEKVLFDFNTIIPIPSTVSDEGKRDWRIENWASKWDSGADEFREGNKLGLTTAWGIPFPVYKALSKRFPDVGIEIDYFIEGDADCGTIKLIEGEVFYEEYICCGYVDYYMDIPELSEFVKHNIL